MYLPLDFQVTDPSAIAQMVEASPLATLVSHGAGGLRADHIPLIMAKDRLIGHIARANDLHDTLADGAAVMAVFRASDAYISANWYPSKAETHEVVPTWNYEVAHVHGAITFSHDDAVKRGVVGQLTKMMERRTNGDAGWKMGDAPEPFLREKLSQIVAFEITITRIEAKAKLSQNKSDADRLGAADGAERSGQVTIATKRRGAR